jgi:EH domain-containing protein 1
MPDPARYRDILASFDLAAFPKLREKDVKALDDALTVDIPALVAAFDNPYRKK